MLRNLEKGSEILTQATKYRNGSDLWLDDKNGKS